MPALRAGPGRLDLTVTKGAKWYQDMTYFTDRAAGTPRDISGGTFTVAVKTAADSSGSSAGTVTAAVLVGASGTFRVQQTEAQVNAMTAGEFWWSLSFAPSGGGDPEAWLYGSFIVEDVVDA